MSLQHAPEATTLTRIPVLDGFLGALAGLVATLTGIGFIGAIVVYFQLRRRYPYFCTGILVGFGLLLAALLGLFLLCIGSLR